jgi:hydrogenase expression/formation protein HypC
MCLAIPGQIVALAPGGHFATVEVSKVRRTINIDLLDGDPAAVGEWVLIHVGFAMSRISAAHAAEQLQLLAMLGEDAQAMEELDGYTFGQEGREGQEGQEG